MPMSPGATRSGSGGTKGTTKKASAKTGGAKATAKTRTGRGTHIVGKTMRK